MLERKNKESLESNIIKNKVSGIRFFILIIVLSSWIIILVIKFILSLSKSSTEDVSIKESINKLICGWILLMFLQSVFKLWIVYWLENSFSSDKGILESNSLWVTYRNFLDDITENKNNKYLIDNYCKEGGAVLEFRNNTQDMFKQNKYIFAACSAKVVYDFEKQITLILEDINEFIKFRTKSNREIPYIEANFKKKNLIKARFI